MYKYKAISYLNGFTSQGFCRYLEQCFSDLKERGVVIGYDARAHPASGGSSKRFASLAAAAFTSRGVPVHLFSDITPTPFVVSHGNACHVNASADPDTRQRSGFTGLRGRAGQRLIVLKPI